MSKITPEERERWRHSWRVAEAVSDGQRHIGLLHDAVEDGLVSLDEIEAVYGAGTRRIIDALTRRDDEDYADYIERVAHAGIVAGTVKLADLRDNLNRMDSAHEHNREKYEKAIERLTGRLA